MSTQTETLRNAEPGMTDADALRFRLAEDHAALIKRHDELIEAEARLPEIVDDDTAGRAADYVKQVTACAKALEGARVAEKEPFLESSRAVDGWFGRPISALIDKRSGLKARVESKLGAYLTKKENEERRRREQEAAEAAERARKAEDEAMALAEASKVTAAQADKALDVAVAAQEVAHKADAAAQAKPADLARTRGDLGALATLSREWTFKDLDRATLDLEALRAHIPADALDKAVRSFVKAGGRVLKGCTIYEAANTRVR